MLLAVSLVAPTIGTTRHDIFYKEGIPRDVKEAMDGLWRPNQVSIDRDKRGEPFLTFSRCAVGSSQEILNWVGILKQSPFSPDGRTGYVVGIGAFFLGSATAEPLYHLLSDGFNNYINFINDYRPGNYNGFDLHSMRLDRIKLTQHYLDDLSNGLTKKDTPRPISNKMGCLVQPFWGSLASFQDVYTVAQNHEDFSRIIVSADPEIFLGSALKELPFVNTLQSKTPDPQAQAEPQRTGLRPSATPTTPRAEAPKDLPKDVFHSAAAATLIPVTEQIAIHGIEALMNLATQQGPEGALARSSLERIRKKLGTARFSADPPK